MTAGWAAAVPLIAAADVCVVGSGAGAILDLAVEPVR
jgi:hypothetical protein